MHRRALLLAAFSSPWARLADAATSSALVGVVTHVADGDTLHWFDGERRRVIRLAGIDAPELAQPFGEESRQSLATLCVRRPA